MRSLAWFAIYVVPNQESAVAARLAQRLGLVVFYPITRERVIRHHQEVVVERGTFSPYLFVRDMICAAWPVRETTGVRGIVCCGGTPLAVPDCVVEAVRISACEEVVDRTSRRSRFRAKIGDLFQVNVEPGNALTGLVGRLSSIRRLDSHNEVSAFITMLGAKHEVKIPADMVGPIVYEDGLLASPQHKRASAARPVAG